MALLPTRFRLFRWLWTADSFVSSGLFELLAFLKRCGSAYSSFLYKYFAIAGIRKAVMGLIDDGFTIGTVFAFGLLAYALPPFSGTGDVWNRGREYAMTFTDSTGAVVGTWGIRQNDAIPLDEISPNLIKAILATEDVRFFEHFGVDLIGTARAIVRNARSDKVQGGSSITQQVAKNLFLSSEQTIERKVREAFFALWLEARLSKEEILKLYLDRSYLGGGNYGVEAAAQYYFGKSARDVSISESAVLAGIFKSPRNYSPHIAPEASKQRADVVLYRMLDSGFLSQGELLQARRSPAQAVQRRASESPSWFLEWAYENTLDVMEENGLQKEFVVEVKSTIDRQLQDRSQAILVENVATLGSAGNFSQAASVTMSPDGAVRAMIGGLDYDVSKFNRSVDALRQSGSSFKPFVYLAALLAGYDPTDIVVDGPVSVGGWSPRNYSGKYGGAVTLSTALAKSYNSIPVKLMQDIGRPAIIKTAHDVGIRGELETWPPMVLGTSALTLLDLTTGYATFAGGGKLAEPYAVLEIRRPNGDLLYARDKVVPPAPQVAPEEKIAQLNSMLGQVVTAGTGRGAELGAYPQGGKTGTNQSYRDAWYIGFTADYVTGVWVGNDDFTPMNEITGGKVPAPIWKQIMEVAEKDKKPLALAGLPITEAHLAFLAEKAKAETQIASADVILVNAPTEESPANTPEQESGEVLKGMFDLFEKNPKIIKPKAMRKSRVKRQGSTQTAYNIPDTNARSTDRGSFLDKIFGSNKAKKKKKKSKAFFDF